MSFVCALCYACYVTRAGYGCMYARTLCYVMYVIYVWCACMYVRYVWCVMCALCMYAYVVRVCLYVIVRVLCVYVCTRVRMRVRLFMLRYARVLCVYDMYVCVRVK